MYIKVSQGLIKKLEVAIKGDRISHKYNTFYIISIGKIPIKFKIENRVADGADTVPSVDDLWWLRLKHCSRLKGYSLDWLEYTLYRRGPSHLTDSEGSERYPWILHCEEYPKDETITVNTKFKTYVNGTDVNACVFLQRGDIDLKIERRKLEKTRMFSFVVNCTDFTKMEEKTKNTIYKSFKNVHGLTMYDKRADKYADEGLAIASVYRVCSPTGADTYAQNEWIYININNMLIEPLDTMNIS